MDVVSEKESVPGRDVGGALERCALCGRLTGVRKDVPVKQRKYYVEAAGQLCAACYAEVYLPVHNDNIVN